ncbi:MAG: 2-phospho-L-lactate guanylyltransferase [Bryobacteraceae bacterium]
MRSGPLIGLCSMEQGIYAMNEIIFLVEDSPDGGFSARALGHSIFTVGDTEQELRAMVKDAVACHFDDREAPQIIRLHYVREEVIHA